MSKKVLVDRDELRRLRNMESLFHFVLAKTTDFIYFKDSNYKFTFVSQAFLELTHCNSTDELYGKDDFDMFSVEHASSYRAIDEQVYAGEPVISFEETYHNAKGQLGWVSTSKIALTDSRGNKIGVFGISRDITEVKVMEEKLKELAHFDELTKLTSRSSFIEKANLLLEVAKREGTSVSLLFIDLDGFKSINDTYGHEAGDVVLQTTAKKLVESFRKADLVARYGGDEFLVLTQESKPPGLSEITSRLIKLVSQPVSFEGNELQVTCSVGIANYPADAGDLQELIRGADSAMYGSKNAGKNQVTLFADLTKDKSG